MYNLDMNLDNFPDENTKRFVAVLNKKIEIGKLMNALGHTTAGLSAEVGNVEEMRFINYEDKDGNIHPSQSHFPFIVLAADNSNQIRKVRNEAIARKIPFTDFTSTMSIGTSQEQVDATSKTSEADLDYWGICLFGETEKLKEFTGKFSLFR
ncbi:MAG: hypothetical protein UW68_C0043G0004 [Candidatus Collierbacteria bacterium GW2011_GWB1_44_6]|uniref:DUF2000 domain-containing protein n=2 Tax=Candidatus Collieribacteriota TaxID=1752725 RepID=A0A0G1LTQ9_9BACT|nr:MAG: hypothetical protein UV68_C0033G0005 [Candidatus Collierbacteria bacterium GW2011_GWC2_43_12]KKT72242.1 MAG: hypothetical protein UW68_C0043G0004 [Candidatus Collierbacteria bacterium GW2011_GWB1_44_6]KKT82530.1 MAG: hypothetical protein UW80_C0035G0004 [Microgenomates group bacterium GW2011_GWC1_44_9]